MKRNRNKFRRSFLHGSRVASEPGAASVAACHLSEVRGKSPDLTMRQAAILLTVYLEPPPHTVRGLAARLGVTKPVITRALDTMGALKLLSRHRDDRDKRNVLVKTDRRGCIVRRAPRRPDHRQGRGTADLTARDPRLHAFRTDLADERLRGEVDAPRFVRAGRPASASRSPISASAPRPDSGSSTQALYGDDVRVFDVAEGWAWIQAERDGYVGYVADAALADRVRHADACRFDAAHFPLSRARPEAAEDRRAFDGLAGRRHRICRDARHGLRAACLRRGHDRQASGTAATAPPGTMSRSPRR